MRECTSSIAPSPVNRMKSGEGMLRIRFAAFMIFVCAGISSAGDLPDNLGSVLDRLESNCSAFGKPSPKRYRAQGTLQQMNSDWKPETVTRTEKEFTFRDSTWQETLIKAVRTKRGGKEEDITREMIENDEKNRRNQKDKNRQGQSLSMDSEDLFVFAKKKRGEYDFSWLSDSLLDGRRVARLSAVPKKKEAERFCMTYAIQPDSMTVLMVEMKPSKNPKMVKQLSMTLSLSRDPDGHYFLRRFWMKLFVNLLVKKIRTEVVEEYGGLEY